MSYLEMFIAVVGLVFGFIVGAIITVYIFEIRSRSIEKRKIKTMNRIDKQKEKAKKDADEEINELNKKAEEVNSQPPLKSRITGKVENSQTYAECEEENRSASDYIQRARKRQDNAYNYIKQKKAEVNNQ